MKRKTHFTRREGFAIWARSNGQCGICGKPVEPGDAEIDHIIPLARGGTNGTSNLQIAHAYCNRMKGVATQRELVRQREAQRAREADDQLFDVEQAAAFLNVKPSTVRTWIRERKLAAYNLGSEGRGAQWRISGRAMNEFLERSYQPADEHDAG